MHKMLVIYLHASPLSEPHWVVNGVLHHGDMAGMVLAAEGRQVVVVVPAQAVVLMQAKLPKMSGARLKQALPFALEERLVDEVDTLHFAAGAYCPDGTLPVAVVAREKMREWLTLLQSWQIHAEVILPGMLALPWQEGVWSVGVQEIAQVRARRFDGFAGDRINLPTLLNLAMAESAEPPSRIQCWNVTGESLLPALTLAVPVEETMLSPEQWLLLMAKTVCEGPTTLNLRQGAFAVKKSRRPKWNNVLKPIRYLALSWLALLILYPLISYAILATRLHHNETVMQRIYYQHFPKATRMVAPKMRLEEKLQSLSGNASQQHFLLLLAQVGDGLKTVSGVRLTQLHYQGSALTLMVSAVSPAAFNALTDCLAQQGLKVKQQNASLAGTHINGSLLID